MIAAPNAAASRPPRSPSSTTSPHTHMQTGSVSRTSSVSSLQQGAVSQVPKGPAKSSGVMQQAMSGTSGRQDVTSSSEFSELENKEALKPPAAKKGGLVLRRVQSKCHASPPAFCSHELSTSSCKSIRCLACTSRVHCYQPIHFNLCIAFNHISLAFAVAVTVRHRRLCSNR